MAPLIADQPAADDAAGDPVSRLVDTKPARRPVENDQYAPFVRRVVAPTAGALQPGMSTPWAT